MVVTIQFTFFILIDFSGTEQRGKVGPLHANSVDHDGDGSTRVAIVRQSIPSQAALFASKGSKVVSMNLQAKIRLHV